MKTIRTFPLRAASVGLSPLLALTVYPYLGCGQASPPGADASSDAPSDANPDAGPPANFNVLAGSCKPLWWAVGDKPGRTLGGMGLATDDLDGDGVRDVAVTSADVDNPGGSRLELRSGKNGDVLRTIAVPGGFVEELVNVEDIDNDGIHDVAMTVSTSAPPPSGNDSGVNVGDGGAPPTELRILSLKSGAWLSQTTGPADEPSFAQSVAAFQPQAGSAGLLLGSPSPSPFPTRTGLVHVASTQGTVTGSITAPAGATPLFGTRAMQTTDLDGDGVRDLLVTDPGASSYLGQVSALSGANDALIWGFKGAAVLVDNPDLLGDNVIAPGDLNGDGITDVVVGVHEHCTASLGPNCNEAGEVLAIDGKTGTRLWAVEGQQGGSCFGSGERGLRPVADLDGDGVADIAVGSPAFGVEIWLGLAGRFTILSGRDGATLADVQSSVGSSARTDYFGVTLDDMGDVDGDGHSDVLVTAPHGSSGAGFIIVWSCLPK